ncbi:hypothetical protein PG994_004901 [Apiospora phragmitis]|uniref:Zn(2)-C6 fungal-type domain-containing protein n=1 Tax=Apiospora phragmitis TaxID=2905665 RepID=A0ABR1VT46_9PEZI
MPGDKKPTPGVSSRRSACDRCRGQKLRCLRKGGDPPGRCDRCAKADTSCTTSPIYRMRNYSVEDDGSSVSRKRRRTGDRSSTHSSQSPRIASTATTATAATTLASGGPAGPTMPPPDSLPMSAAAQTTPTTGTARSFEWHFEDAMQRSSNGGTMIGIHHFAMPPPPPDWCAFSNPATPAFSTPVVTSAGVWDHHDLTMTQNYTAENADKSTTTSLNSPVGGSMPQYTFSATQAQQTPQLQQAHTTEGMHWPQPPSQQVSMSDYFTQGGSNSHCMTSYQVNELESRSHNPMEMLTSINLELVTLLKQVTQPHTHLNALTNPTSGNPEPSNTSILEKLLSLTQEFLSIMDVIAGAPQTPHTPHTPHTPLSSSHAKTPMVWAGGAYGGGYASGSESASMSAYGSDINSPSDSSGTTQYSPHRLPCRRSCRHQPHTLIAICQCRQRRRR